MSSIVTERLLVNEIKETMVSPAYGVNTFSTTDSCIFYVTYNPGTTINLTNVQLVDDGIVSVTFISPLGVMSMPTTVTINGVTRAVKWSGGTAPTSSSGSVVLLTLSIITVNGAFAYVIGGKSNFS
jgi:hypothetical protein